MAIDGRLIDSRMQDVRPLINGSAAVCAEKQKG